MVFRLGCHAYRPRWAGRRDISRSACGLAADRRAAVVVQLEAALEVLDPREVVVLREDVAVFPRHVVAVQLPGVVFALPGQVEVEADQEATVATDPDVGRD